MTTEGLPEFLLSDLPTANRPNDLKRVQHDCLAAEAKKIMRENDFSQLPVLADDGRIHGVVSWRSLACNDVGAETTAVEVCEPIPDRQMFHLDDPVVEVLDILFDDEFILTRDGNEDLCGIVTAADMARWAKHSLKAYLAVATIERLLRKELDDAHNALDRDPVGPDSWTFGAYIECLEDDEIWQHLLRNAASREINQSDFLNRLRAAKGARNRTFHFHSERTEAEIVDQPAAVRERDADLLADIAVYLGSITGSP